MHSVPGALTLLRCSMRSSEYNTAAVTRRPLTALRITGMLLLSLLFAHAPASAQLTSGTISGTIVDQTTAALPGTTVTMTNTGTGLIRTVVTNERGFYEAPNLPLGNYEVSASLQGFGTAVRQDVQLTVGRTVVIDMALALAGLAEVVVVTGETSLIETTSATVANLINSRQVQDLPLVNRDLTQLTFLQPGVVKIPSSGDQGVFSGMGDKFTVAGARGTQNLYLLDGVSNSDLSGNPQGSSGSYLGSETVQEIQIITNNYSAEYRSAAGGIVSAVTKSGANTLHGSVFEFFRSDALDARNFFDKKFDLPKSNFDRNQFGGTLGGPILRNRIFFFASYEGLVEDLSLADTATVPSINARQGRLARRSVSVSPAIVPYLSLWPVPGQGNTVVEDFGDTVLIAGTLEQPTRNTFALGKIDYNVNGGNTLSATYNFDKGHRSPFGLLGDTTAVGTESVKHVVATKWTSVLSNASVNEINMGYSDSRPTGGLPLSTIDFRSQGLIFRANRQHVGQLDVRGVDNVGYRRNASFYQQRSYTAKNVYSSSRGNHSLRAGGEWTYFRYNVVSCSRGCNGVFQFRSLENFLRANPRRFDVMLAGGFESPRDLRQHLLGVYFQDNWRVRTDFTLNLGLRYEFASVPREVNGRVSNLLNFTDPEVTVGILYKNPTAKAFSPRVGMVWAPHEGKTSVRAGFGIFYEHPMLYNIRTSLQEMPPFTLTGRISGRDIDFPNAYFTQLERARGRPNLRTMEYDLDQTTYYRWSTTVQRQLGTNWAVTLDYTGSRGYNLWQQSVPNLNRWEGWPAQPPPGTPKFFPAGSGPINPNFGEMRVQFANAHLWYSGASLGVQRRLSDGLQLGTAFTYSKAVDEGSGVTRGGDELPQGQRGIYAWDLHLKKGPAAYDIRKVFSANFSYELPFGENLTGLARALGMGWQVNGIVSLADGYALSVEETNEDQFDRIGDDEQLRPDLIPNGNSNPVTGDPDAWFDISQFQPSRIGYFGNLERGTVRSPGLATVDLSVFKNITVGTGRLQLRFETFNLFNRTNFGTPDMEAFINGEPNPSAGRITSTRTPARQTQLGIRWSF